MLDVAAAFALLSVNTQTDKVPTIAMEWGSPGTLKKELVIQQTNFVRNRCFEEIEAILAPCDQRSNDCDHCLVATHYCNDNEDYYECKLINLNHARIVPKDLSRYGTPDAIFRKLKVIHDYYVRYEKLMPIEEPKKEDPDL